MSQSTRNHDQPIWLRIKMIAQSRAHRSMKRQTLKLPTNLCPTIDEWFQQFRDGLIDSHVLRNRLGQVHADYVNALEQNIEKHIKTRRRLMWTERVVGKWIKEKQAELDTAKAEIAQLKEKLANAERKS